MESGRRKCEGVRGNRSGVKSKEESPRELGMEEGGGEQGKVWKLADRTGYAQTENQAQTWEHYLSIWNTSPVFLSPRSLKKSTINSSPTSPIPAMLFLTRAYKQSPFCLYSSLSFLFKKANTNIHTSVILNCCSAIERILENPGCWPTK